MITYKTRPQDGEPLKKAAQLFSGVKINLRPNCVKKFSFEYYN